MPKFTIEYDDNETMPDRIVALAAEHGITPEMLIRRAISEHVGTFGLRAVPADFEADSMEDWFVEIGIIKTKTGEEWPWPSSKPPKKGRP